MYGWKTWVAYVFDYYCIISTQFLLCFALFVTYFRSNNICFIRIISLNNSFSLRHFFLFQFSLILSFFFFFFSFWQREFLFKIWTDKKKESGEESKRKFFLTKHMVNRGPALADGLVHGLIWFYKHAGLETSKKKNCPWQHSYKQ